MYVGILIDTLCRANKNVHRQNINNFEISPALSGIFYHLFAVHHHAKKTLMQNTTEIINTQEVVREIVPHPLIILLHSTHNYANWIHSLSEFVSDPTIPKQIVNYVKEKFDFLTALTTTSYAGNFQYNDLVLEIQIDEAKRVWLLKLTKANPVASSKSCCETTHERIESNVVIDQNAEVGNIKVKVGSPDFHDFDDQEHLQQYIKTTSNIKATINVSGNNNVACAINFGSDPFAAGYRRTASRKKT